MPVTHIHDGGELDAAIKNPGLVYILYFIFLL